MNDSKEPEFRETAAPVHVGSKTSHSHWMLFFEKPFKIPFAMFSKFLVAKASIVGPAPERQIPQRPG